MKEINDFLLNMFTCKDDLRPSMMFPNSKDGIVYATDGHVLIAIPENELSLKYNTNDKFPNAKKHLDEALEENLTGIKVKVADIAKELVKARIEVDKKFVPCKECKGAGTVEWEYEDKNERYHYHEFDCPECGGDSGKSVAHPFARVGLSMIEHEDMLRGITIDDILYHPFQLYRLFMVALTKGYETIEIFHNPEKYGSTVTCFGDIKVVVLAMAMVKKR